VITRPVSGKSARPTIGISVQGQASCQRIASAISPPSRSISAPSAKYCLPIVS
jgi:hypothetical protein